MGRGGLGSYVTASVWAIAGGVGTVAGTEALLGAKNTGILGYGANFLAAVLLGQLVGKGMKNKQAGVAVTLGGVVATVARIIRDRTPFGQYVNQAFGQSGIGDWGVGEYIQSTSFQPMQIQSNQWPAQVLPAVIQNLQARAAAPAPMQGLGRRSAGARQDLTRF